MDTNVNIPVKCAIGDKEHCLADSWEARILYLKNYGSHYEIRIHSYYGSVLVLFGKTAFGYFACIPDFEAGCHLSHLKDIFWNIEQLVRIIDEVTGITIAEALRAVADYIGPKVHKED
ncbi:DUF6618 family protein [Fonticella tunisiensis]|uniref:Uncharacterized protein n=1 Tax=Fonticella tunisiensis TaxID=1096341 RepID=A0A4R7K9K9_9CLOT|nr:DUF6618 family protein [Fonticella tunisiensis]TDT50759.1 hypothetical protein EDD71_12550 [Fonticella tunisiensis]